MLKFHKYFITDFTKFLPKFNGILDEWEVELVNPYIVCKNKFLYQHEFFSIVYKYGLFIKYVSHVELTNIENNNIKNIDLYYIDYTTELEDQMIKIFRTFNNEFWYRICIINSKIYLDKLNMDMVKFIKTINSMNSIWI